MKEETLAARYALAAKIVRLVDDVRDELGNREPRYGARAIGSAPPRNWNATVVNALPEGGFIELFWADVYRVPVGRRVTIGHSDLVDRFVDEHRFLITEWELLGQVGE